MASQGDTSIPYKPGTIKSIKLTNFMCHDSFELPLGPNVNFIIGPNGSGKSALLTALTVALGARATHTARGKKASDFIKYGAKWARITLVIHNYDKIMTKDQAFKPDEYGKTITVEKTLYREEGVAIPSRLSLKDDKNKKVSERSQELHEMLDHFGIMINNPICILNQEVSKTFLHSKKPEDKFELFMKATNLEQIEQDYESANSSFKEWNSSNTQRNVSFALLDKEYAACEEKVSFLMQSAKLADVLDELNREFVFATDRENEALAKEHEKKLQALKKVIEDANDEIEKRDAKIKTAEEEIQICKTRIASINENMEESKKKFQDIRSKELDIKTKQVNLKQKIEDMKRRINRNKDDKNSLEKSIEDKKKELKDQNDLDNDNEQRKIDIECLEREIPNDKAREKSLQSHTNQLNESMTSVRAQLQAANMRVNELRTRMSQTQANVRRLKNGQENVLRRYGDSVIKIREEIDRAYAEKRFTHKPIGPLGYYLKLRSPDVSQVLEIHLGRNAHAFACDNHQDMNTLNMIFNKIRAGDRNFRPPMIITRPFGRKHDVSGYKAKHAEYKTLVDYLEFQNDAAFNALVDRCALENVLFIPDYHLAEALMLDERAVPRHTRMAYTKDCSTMFPRSAHGGYRSYANKGNQIRYLFSETNTEQIRKAENEISLIEAELRDAENISKTIQNNLEVQRHEYEQNIAESRKLLAQLRKKEEKLLNLKTTITVQPQELSALETEYENLLKTIASNELIVEQNKESLSLIEKELDDITTEKKSVQQVLTKHEENRQKEFKLIEDSKRTINDFKQFINDKKVIIENREKSIADLKVKIDLHLEKMARTKQKMNEDWVRPKEIRRTDIITIELNKVKKQIEVQREENQDPDEVMRNLAKRMEEIRSLTELKNKNSLNFTSCEKKLSHRKEGFSSLRSNTIAAVSATFSTVMRTMKMNGMLEIYLEDIRQDGEVVKRARTLEMRIDTNYNPRQRASLSMNGNDVSSSQLPEQAEMAPPPRPKRARVSRNTTSSQQEQTAESVKMTDTRSLSGGERSFSTVAFVLALWHHCQSPFKLMDEIDVFMDMVTRRVSYNALIRFAQYSDNPGQFIFFSPLELPKIDNAGHHVRVFEMPSIVRKRPLSQLNEGGDE